MATRTARPSLASHAITERKKKIRKRLFWADINCVKIR